MTLRNYFRAIIVSIALSALLCVCAFATDYSIASFKTTPFEAAPSGEITTTLYIEEGSNLIDFQHQLKYDTGIVSLTSVTPVADLVGDIEVTQKDGAVHISYTRTSANLTKYTEFVKLTFTVDANVGPESYDFLSLDTDYHYEAHTMID